MSRNNLELRKGTGEYSGIVWLNYWDLSQGKDRIIEIRDGKAYLKEWEFSDPTDIDTGVAVYTEVNLVEFLITLADEIG